jgi:hypothetical protein
VELVADRDEAAVYHAAAELPLAEAAKLVERASAGAIARARGAFDAFDADFGTQSRLSAAGIVEANGAPLPSLAAILRSHALIHSAEAVLFRSAIAAAGRERNIIVVGARSKELQTRAATAIGVEVEDVAAWVVERGRAVGRPWGRDEKDALLVACVALTAR